MSDQVYVYRWGKYLPHWKGRRLRVLARGSMNQAMVQFVDNGERAVISRNAIRKEQP
jgi:hypothetical protein